MSRVDVWEQGKRPATIMVKVAMAVSGVGMTAWVTLHMAGNMLWLLGPEAMDRYGGLLHGSGILWPVRLLLLAGVAVHVLGALITSRQGLRARPIRYRRGLRPHASSVGSRSMRISGTLLLVFMVYHVLSVYGVAHPAYVPEAFHHNLSALLTQPLDAILLLLASGFLCLHLSHGLASAWISVGLISARREAQLRRALSAWTLLVSLGFLTPPLVRWVQATLG
jgi:succinate dehydrogenase / fumarate reductase cytochrome b subunit